MHAARVAGQLSDDHVGAGRHHRERKLSGSVGIRRDDAGDLEFAGERFFFDGFKRNRDARQHMPQWIDDRPADARGRGLGQEREGAGGPEHEETRGS